MGETGLISLRSSRSTIPSFRFPSPLLAMQWLRVILPQEEMGPLPPAEHDAWGTFTRKRLPNVALHQPA